MAAAKWKIGKGKTDGEVVVKKKRAARMEDRLGDLPDALKIRILACLNTKQAVQTSILSRTWVSLWTWIPVLELSYVDFRYSRVIYDLRMFEKFVNEFLCRRDHLTKLDRLKLTLFHGCGVEMLKNVFDYAFSHGVKRLEAWINLLDDCAWPVRVCDALTSLNLQSRLTKMRVPFLGPGSVSFKNLSFLSLTRALITDVEPFSGFPVLKSLKLIHCKFSSRDGNLSKALRIQALRLSHLTITHCGSIRCCELWTPRLRYLKYRGPVFSHEGGLDVLETMEINFHHFIELTKEEREKRLYDDMMSLFCTLHSVKSVTLSSVIVHTMFLFPDELVGRGLPFRRLKDLKLDLSDRHCHNYPSWFESPSRESFEFVKAHLLHHSPDAKLTITNPSWSSFTFESTLS